MSEKEMALNLLKDVPSYKLGYVIAFLQGIMADETADDLFCEQLCKEYEESEEKGNYVTLEEMAKMSGVNLGEV